MKGSFEEVKRVRVLARRFITIGLASNRNIEIHIVHLLRVTQSIGQEKRLA